MARAGFVRRHRARIASAAALTLAAGAVVAYAVTADGYQSHEAELNDGGVWVVNGAKGWSGRINKPINQLDGVVPGEDSELRMDILQDGAAVVALNLDSGRGQAIETARLANVEGGAASMPASGDVAMGGGTLASTDSETGKVWAVRYDPREGRPTMSAVDRNGKPVETVGKDSTLTVSQAGTVVVVSAGESTVTTLEPEGDGFAPAGEQPLGADAGGPTAVTTVGERVVTLDSRSGSLQVVGGPRVAVPEDSVLQQAGPVAEAVLVGTRSGLLEVDLESGTTSEVVHSSGTPAAPVRLGACAFGAWSGGTGTVADQCGGEEPRLQKLKGKATNLVFRVNRGAIVLNDALSGSVWDVQQDRPIKIDTWESFTSRKKKKDDEKKDEERIEAERRPPKARPDTYGVRHGRTTVIHPLDNDSAPEGRLLSIVGVDAPTNGARVDISPDGQTLVVNLPGDARTSTFEYHVNDGRSGLSAHAPVTVNVRGRTLNAQPALRRGYTKPTFHVPNGGSLSVPVLADWRDDADGDALLLESAEVAGGAETGVSARTTSDGRIRVVAAPLVDAPARTVRVDYTVSDGRSAGVRKALDFRVQAAKDETTHPPTAAPDVVRGEVGKPVKIRPLLNDLPGSDPTTRHAELGLGGKIPRQPGADVRTDLDGGVVTLVADRAGTFFLDYDAAFGSAPMDRGTIRVDVLPRPKRGGEPVAMPDSLTVFGQAPGVVDVLANDMDPAGSLLVVRRADPSNAGDLDVAVVDGRWLRVSARRPDLSPATQVVTYTVSNGPHETRGELVVSQRPEPADNTPVTTADHAVVRAGSSVSVPVLDNDVSPGGDRLTLVTDVAEGTSGELRVIAPVDLRGEPGRAFVSGRVVRYVAPAGLRERETFEVPYVAQNLAGVTAEGRARITVIPHEEGNTPPEPPTLEGRVVAGDTVKVRLPGVGVDPEGDAVTVTGITSAPRLGLVTAHGGNFLEYRAYPRSSGTDEFTYAVVDGKGAFATGTVRVAVVALGEPQPPLAVADRLMVKPGRTATFDPLANDFVAPGDRVQVELVEEREGVSLDPTTNLVTIKAPRDASARALQVVYRLTNGLAESRATMTLDVNPEFNNPPVVYDAFGRAGESEAVEVDVLDGAYDPDGPAKGLEVVEVLGDQAGTAIEGSTIIINRRDDPQVVPFRVEDADGGSATASVYVPPTGGSLPFVRPDATIKLDVGGSASARVTDHVEAPDGRNVRLVEGRSALAASPSALSVERDGRNGFTVRSTGDHQGPGAVLVEVTTATDASGNEDASSTDDGATALLSIPVQVGDDVPQLTCPDNVFPLSTGQRLELDLGTVCSVWTVDPRDADGLEFSADWSSTVDGVGVARQGDSVFAVSVSDDANRGGEAVLEVRAGDSNPAQLRFRLSAAPSPTMLQVPMEEMEAGETRTIDLAPYLQPGVARPRPTVVSVSPIGSAPVRASSSGSSVTLRALEGARGRAAFRVVMSDVADSSPPDERTAEGRISFEVGGVPGKPGEPQIYRPEESSRVDMDWLRPADDGGAPITHYVLEAIGTKINRVCRTTRCSLGGLKTDKDYRFRVRAVNKVGPGEWSDPSVVAVALTRPGRVENIRMTGRGDGFIKIGWDKPRVNAQRLLEYEVRWGDQVATVPASTREYVATPTDNNRTYSFRIRVRNQAGEVSDSRESADYQSAGTPAAPTGLTAVDNQSGASQTSVGLSWHSTLPEGPAPTTYTVSVARNGGKPSAVPGCVRLSTLRCTHAGVDYDGSRLDYVVHAYNDVGNRSPASATASVDVVGRPADWGTWTARATGRDQQLQVEADSVPDPRGRSAEMFVRINGIRHGSSVRVRQGQRISRTVTVPSNGEYRVQLELCNEGGGCNESSAQTVQVYGPITDVHLDPITARPEGEKTIKWTIHGNTNGRPAQLEVTIGNNAPQITNHLGEFTLEVQTTAENYDQEIRLTATLRDPDINRGSTSESSIGRSGPPPPPVIQIGKGAACNDGAGSTAFCQGATHTRNNDVCEEDSCAFVTVSWSNVTSSQQCTLDYQGTFGGWHRWTGVTVPVGSGSDPAWSYFRVPFGGNGNLRVVCGGTQYSTVTW